MSLFQCAAANLAALAALIALSACEQRTWTKDEIADIAGDAAWQSVDGVDGAARQSDLEELTSRIETLENENSALKAELSAVADQADRIALQVSDNAAKYNSHLDDYARHTHRGY